MDETEPSPPRVGPVDPRLLTLSAPVRRWLLTSGLLSAAQTIAVVLFGVLVGQVVAGVIEDPEAPIASGSVLSPWYPHLISLVVVSIVWGSLVWAERRFGRRAAAGVIDDLRSRALARLAVLDPRVVDRARWRITLGEGLDGLTPYLTGFIPALTSTLIATPAVLAVVFFLDPGSAVIALVTLPLIPLFMWLVGTLTAGRTERRLRGLAVLSDQLLDLAAGLPTLRAFGRQRSPAEEVRRLSAEHRTSTMSVLRIAFLSSFVLEFLATLSVALIAVGIGFRLLGGSITLAVGLTVLIIVPEVYNPVRNVGTRFHDAQDGLVAADDVLSLLDAPCPTTSSTSPMQSARELPPPAHGLSVHFNRLSVAGRDGLSPCDLSGTAQPGTITVLHGPNGAGKSTALLALLGIIDPDADSEDSFGGVSVLSSAGALHGDELWQRTSYVPQRPLLPEEVTAGTGNVGDTSALSLGERQRAAVYASLDDKRDLLVLDEPTAHLDEENAVIMLAALRKRAAAGATVLLASHDPAVLAEADITIEVHHG